MRNLFLALCITLGVGALTVIGSDPQTRENFLTKITGINEAQMAKLSQQEASLFFVPTATVADLQQKYAAVPSTKRKVRILVMPGHEPSYGGAEYRNLKERDMNVELANDLADLLNKNEKFEAIVPRSTSRWDPVFDNYFTNNWGAIKKFAESQKTEMTWLINTGHLQARTPNVIHNDAPTDVALRIYGINKWANENNIDVAIHVHFNDEPGHSMKSPGEYSGFAIYVPEQQYSNSTTAHAIADKVFSHLSKYYPVSTMPQERSGVIEDQDLIAVGSRNTSDAPSMLVEYSYIYEPQLQEKGIRSVAMQDMAFQTYLGLQDFFGGKNDISTFDNLILPHDLNKKMEAGDGPNEDIFALQTALMLDGDYPPTGDSKNDCPRTGKFGPCTKDAVTQFQKKYGITGENGILGAKTRSKLNELY